jgi:hypothetical protein
MHRGYQDLHSEKIVGQSQFALQCEAMPIVQHKVNLKRFLAVIALGALIVLEAGLLEGFLPYEMRHAIHQQSKRIFPETKYDPHPDMDWEFELDYRQHPWHRTVVYGLQGILVVGVGYLILRTGRVLLVIWVKSPCR